MDIKFHCSEQDNFPHGVKVRAFSYTDYAIEMHNHDFYEVNIVLSGSGTHRIENGSFPVRRGDVFVIPPLVAHAYEDTQALEVYHILLKKSFLADGRAEAENVKGFLQFTEIEPFLRSNFSQSCFLHVSRHELFELQNELSFIDDHSRFSREDCSQMKYHAVWKLLYWFSHALYEQLEQKKSDNRYEKQIIGALEYIHRHFGEKITIATLCQRSFLSRSTFLRQFKAVCGMSPIEYLHGYRCKKAIELLRSPTATKTEIAHTCGFYDLSHMERMLKNTSK